MGSEEGRWLNTPETGSTAPKAGSSEAGGWSQREEPASKAFLEDHAESAGHHVKGQEEPLETEFG